MSEFRKVQKISATLLVSIPARMAEALGIGHGSFVQFDLVEDKLVLKPVRTDDFLSLGLKGEGEVCEA